MMSAYELAKELGVVPVSIYRYVAAGMPHKKQVKGKRHVLRFDLKEANKWLQTERDNSKVSNSTNIRKEVR